MLTISVFLFGVALAGCVTAVEVPTVVTLEMDAEQARDLPTMASGATTIMGARVPDAHGRLDVILNVTHPGLTNASLDFKDVELRGVRLDLQVGGIEIPVRILRIDGGMDWHAHEPNAWNGTVFSGSRLGLWWTVDRDRAESPTDAVLDSGAAYELRVAFDWFHSDMNAHAAGHLEESYNGVIRATNGALGLRIVGQPRLEAGLDGVTLHASYQLPIGIRENVTRVRTSAVYLGTRDTVRSTIDALPEAPAEPSGDALDGLDAWLRSLGGAGAERGGQADAGVVAFGTTSVNASSDGTLRVAIEADAAVLADGAGAASDGEPVSVAPPEGLYVVYVEVTTSSGAKETLAFASVATSGGHATLKGATAGSGLQ